MYTKDYAMTNKKAVRILASAGMSPADILFALEGKAEKDRADRKAKIAASARPGTPAEVKAAKAVSAFIAAGGKTDAPIFLLGLSYVEKEGKTTDSAWARIVKEYDALPDMAK